MDESPIELTPKEEASKVMNMTKFLPESDVFWKSSVVKSKDPKLVEVEVSKMFSFWGIIIAFFL